MQIDIDAAILRRDSSPAIAVRFTVSEDAIDRHRANHVVQEAPGAALVPKPMAMPMAAARRRLDAQQLAIHVIDEAERIGQLAEADGQYGAAMRKLDHVRGILDLASKRPPEPEVKELSDDELEARRQALRARLLAQG